MDVIHVRGMGWLGTRSDERGDYALIGNFDLDSAEELLEELEMFSADGGEYIVIDLTGFAASLPQVFLLLGILLTHLSICSVILRGMSRVHREQLDGRMPGLRDRFVFMDDWEGVERYIALARMPVKSKKPS